MALDKDFDGNNDIAQFLEKFKEQPFPSQSAAQEPALDPSAPSVRPAQYARSFEKLEQKRCDCNCSDPCGSCRRCCSGPKCCIANE